MTAPTKNRQSAYPATVADLLPEARALAARLGELPSRNRLMTELHIGATKANGLLAELRRLHLVTDTTDPDADAPNDARAEPTAADPAPADTEPEPDATEPADADSPDPDTGTEPTAAGPAVEAEPEPDTATDDQPQPQPSAPVTPDTNPAPKSATQRRTRVSVWPVLLLTLPAFAAVWSGWVSLGGMAGFGVVHPLPGIADRLSLNTAITLPIGVEVYAAYALWVWLSAGIPQRARKFARTSAIASLITGAAGQVTYHLLSAAHYTQAPWPVTMLVACLPVAVLGMGAALAHLVRDNH